MNQIRPAAVAGAFYSSDAQILNRDLDLLLAQASKTATPDPVPKALIVPHAGYLYSGPTAALAYRRLTLGRGEITRVVLLGPAHRVAVRGLALPHVQAFATPLGQVRLDQEACARLLDLKQVVLSDASHAQEHSLEVQLPFLQKVLGDFALVPLVVGEASALEVAQVLESVWGGTETLIVISSDLSHYLPYAQAQRIDQHTCDMILNLQTGISHEQACGGTPINGLLLAAKQHGLKPELLDLRNSGDTAGTPDKVVGYAAFAFMVKTHVH